MILHRKWQFFPKLPSSRWTWVWRLDVVRFCFSWSSSWATNRSISFCISLRISSESTQWSSINRTWLATCFCRLMIWKKFRGKNWNFWKFWKKSINGEIFKILDFLEFSKKKLKFDRKLQLYSKDPRIFRTKNLQFWEK